MWELAPSPVLPEEESLSYGHSLEGGGCRSGARILLLLWKNFGLGSCPHRGEGQDCCPQHPSSL